MLGPKNCCVSKKIGVKQFWLQGILGDLIEPKILGLTHLFHMGSSV